jgi:hypothetical protein
MRRLVFVLVLVLLTGVGLGVRSADAGFAASCCVCGDCGTGPALCSLAPLSCDVTCQQQNCTSFGLGNASFCGGLSQCGAAQPAAPAPAASSTVMAGMVAMLAGIGLLRLRARRR